MSRINARTATSDVTTRPSPSRSPPPLTKSFFRWCCFWAPFQLHSVLFGCPTYLLAACSEFPVAGWGAETRLRLSLLQPGATTQRSSDGSTTPHVSQAGYIRVRDQQKSPAAFLRVQSSFRQSLHSTSHIHSLAEGNKKEQKTPGLIARLYKLRGRIKATLHFLTAKELEQRQKTLH